MPLVPLDPAAHVAGLERAHWALCQASRRLDEYLRDHKNYVHAPLTEFCWWVVSLDEGFRKSGLIPGYAAAREASPDGRVVEGIRYARNALGHERLTVTRRRGGLTLPLRLPLTITPIEHVWVGVDEFSVGKSQPRNRTAYENHVAGRKVQETQTAAMQWIAVMLQRAKVAGS